MSTLNDPPKMQVASQATHVEAVLPPATANIWARVGAVGVILLTTVLPQLHLVGLPLIIVSAVLGLLTIVCLLVSAKRVTPEVVDVGRQLFNTVSPAIAAEIERRRAAAPSQPQP